MKKILTLLATALLASCANTGTTVGTGSTPGVKAYPLETCIVTDNELGSMGTPVTKVYGDQQVKFCCAPCVKKFEKNPERYLAKLR